MFFCPNANPFSLTVIYLFVVLLKYLLLFISVLLKNKVKHLNHFMCICFSM